MSILGNFIYNESADLLEVDEAANEALHSSQTMVVTLQTPNNDLTWDNGDTLADEATAPIFIINDILEVDSHGILGGASMTFKTFAELRLAYSVCTGADFFGHKVFNTGKVLYVCGEGKGALSRRIKALKLTEGDFNGNLFILRESIRIDKSDDMIKLRRAIAKVQ